MTRKMAFGLMGLLGSFIAGTILAFMFWNSHGDIPGWYWVWAIAIGIAGTLSLAILMGEGLNLSSLSHNLEDDAEELKKGNLTPGVTKFLLTVVLGLFALFFIYKFNKMETTWMDFPVWGWGTLGAVLVAGILVNTEWFKERYYYTDWKVYAIPSVAVVLCIILGVMFTEDKEQLFSNRPVATYESHYQPFYYSYVYSSSNSGGGSYSTPSCSGKSCGQAMLAIFLVVLALILIIGSAVVPHFWFFSVIVLLSVATIIAIRDLIYRPRHYRSPPKPQPVVLTAESPEEKDYRICQGCGRPFKADEVNCPKCGKPRELEPLRNPRGLR